MNNNNASGQGKLLYGVPAALTSRALYLVAVLVVGLGLLAPGSVPGAASVPRADGHAAPPNRGFVKGILRFGATR